MINCPECGTENQENSSFCVECGAVLKAERFDTEIPSAIEEPPYDPDNEATIVSSRWEIEQALAKAREESESSPAAPPPVENIGAEPVVDLTPPTPPIAPKPESYSRSPEPPSTPSSLPPEPQAATPPADDEKKVKPLYLALGAVAIVLLLCGCACLALLGISASSPEFEELLEEMSFIIITTLPVA